MSTLAILELFSDARDIDEFIEEFGLAEDDRVGMDRLVEACFLVEEEFDERSHQAEFNRRREEEITNGSVISYLELIMSEACNFRCTYCIHFNNLEAGERLRQGSRLMSWVTARATVDGYLALLKRQGRREAAINFGGGEPLLNWSVIKQVIEHCRTSYFGEFDFRFSLNTNGALITSEIAMLLKECGASVAVSLDGLRDGNDRVRLDNAGRGTFDRIVRGIETLKRVGHPIDGVAVTISEHNFRQLDKRIIDWAAERLMTSVRIDIDVIGMIDVAVLEIVERLINLRNHGLANGIEVVGFWSRPAENMNVSTIKEPTAFCGAVGGSSMCVSPSGNIYGCGYSNTQLGELANFSSFHRQNGRYHAFVRDRQTGSMEMCRGCIIEGSCGGGCNITQEFARVAKTPKIERMCDFYRLMTKELLLEQLRGESEKERR